MAAISTGKNEPNLTHWIERLRNVEPGNACTPPPCSVRSVPKRNAVPALMDALIDDVPEVRRMAAAALGEIGAEARMAIPALMQSLKDRDDHVRRRCIIALGGMGSEARMAAPAWCKHCATLSPWCAAGPPPHWERSVPPLRRRFPH